MHPTPDEAEQAFYEAFMRRDIDAMMQVWLEEERITCIHPGRDRLRGLDPVRESWEQVFDAPDDMSIAHSSVWRYQGPRLAVHIGHEHLSGATSGLLVVTNVFELGREGWQMLLHHASPVGHHQSNDVPPALH